MSALAEIRVYSVDDHPFLRERILGGFAQRIHILPLTDTGRIQIRGDNIPGIRRQIIPDHGAGANPGSIPTVIGYGTVFLNFVEF